MKKSLLLDFFIADINMHFININTKIFKEFVKLYSEKFIYLIFTILTLISPPFGRARHALHLLNFYQLML